MFERASLGNTSLSYVPLHEQPHYMQCLNKPQFCIFPSSKQPNITEVARLRQVRVQGFINLNKKTEEAEIQPYQLLVNHSLSQK